MAPFLCVHKLRKEKRAHTIWHPLYVSSAELHDCAMDFDDELEFGAGFAPGLAINMLRRLQRHPDHRDALRDLAAFVARSPQWTWASGCSGLDAPAFAYAGLQQAISARSWDIKAKNVVHPYFYLYVIICIFDSIYFELYFCSGFAVVCLFPLLSPTVWSARPWSMS